VFADLGGLFNTLIIIGNILVAQLNKKKFDYDLINKTFYIDQENINEKGLQINNIFLNNKNKNERNLNLENRSLKSEDIIYNNLSLEQKVQSIISFKNSIEKARKLKEMSIIIPNKNNSYNSITDNYKNNQNFSYNQINEIDGIRDKNNKKKLNESISKQIIELEDIRIKELKISDHNEKEKEFKASEQAKNVYEKNLKEKITNFLKNEKKNINLKKFVKLSKCEFCLKLIPCKRIKSKSFIEKENLIAKAEDKIAEILDVCNYIRLFENFEKLKLILMDPSQILSFDYLKNRNADQLFKENYDKRLYESILYFKQKIKDLTLREYDFYLLNNLNQEFKELILE